MNTEQYIAELNRIAGFLGFKLPTVSELNTITGAMREYAALLAKASEGEPSDGDCYDDEISGKPLVTREYADWHRAKHIAALKQLAEREVEIERHE